MIKVDKDTSVEDVLEALKVMEVLGQDRADLAGNLQATPGEGRERLIAKLQSELRVIPKKKKPKRLSWQKKRANRRAIQRKYQEGRRERVNKEWALKLIEGKPEDMYFWVSKRRGDARYKYQRPGWEITYEDYLEYIHPRLGDRVPIVRRYDTKGPWSMSNTIWFDSDDKTVILFDGAEWDMRRRGYLVE